jgi:hypothetical protein
MFSELALPLEFLRLKQRLPFAYDPGVLVYPTIETEVNNMYVRPHAYLQRSSGLSPRASIISATCRSCAASCAPDVVGALGGAEARDQEATANAESCAQFPV